MKSVLFVITLTFAFSLFAKSGGGGVVGNGGSVVENNGELVSADLLFKPRHFKIPLTYLKKVDFKQDAEFMHEFSNLFEVAKSLNFEVANFFNYNFREQITSEKILSNFLFYYVSKLSGEDRIKIDGLDSKQVAYTYTVFDKKEDLSGSDVYKFVELEEKNFKLLSPRQKALIVFHEICHHISLMNDHEIISPFIKSLDLAEKIYRRQSAGDWRKLTREEYVAVSILKNISVASSDFIVDPEYGGLIKGINSKNDLGPNNKFGITSRVEFAEKNMDLSQYSNNVFTNSEVVFRAHESALLGRACSNNRFNNVSMHLLCAGSFNTFLDMKSHLYIDCLKIVGDRNYLEKFECNDYSRNLVFKNNNRFIRSKMASTEPTISLVGIASKGQEFREQFNEISNLTLIDSSVSRIATTAARLTVENSDIRGGIYFLSRSSSPVFIKGLRLTFNEPVFSKLIMQHYFFGYAVIINAGQSTYDFHSSVIDVSRSLSRNYSKVSSPKKFPLYEVSSKEELFKVLN